MQEQAHVQHLESLPYVLQYMYGLNICVLEFLWK